MAPKSHKNPTKLFLQCLLAMFLCSQSSQGTEIKETNITVYLQDKSAGPGTPGGLDYTVVPVTGIPGKLWAFNSFGTIYCGDEPLTEGGDEGSAPVGRMQGIFVTASLDGTIVHLSVSLVFTNKKYSGSTLEVQGASSYLNKVREVAVVGGTGKFRYARGFATFETVDYEASTAYSLIQCNITVQHYENLSTKDYWQI